MATVTRFDIEKFDGKLNFSIWKVQMMAVLTQSSLKKALGIKPATMSDEDWSDLDDRAMSTIQLCLTKEVLRQVIDATSTADLWLKLEQKYMTKSLANKIRLKERLYTLRMAEGTPIQKHLDEFNQILLDLQNLEVSVEDEDKAILLIVSLPFSYKHFKEIMLYRDSESLDYQDVVANLLSKEKFDLEVSGDLKGEGLCVQGNAPEKNDHKRVRSDEALLEGLQPARNLEKLKVYCYSGRRIPSWARGENLATLLPNLVEIVFSSWKKVLELPCLGKLPHLKKLRVEGLWNLEYIGKRTMWDDGSSNEAAADTSHECCSSSFYPSLEELYLICLSQLKGWWGGSFVFTPNSSGAGGDEIVRGRRSMQSQVSHRLPSFPRLSHLKISECSRLTTIPLCPTVETLELRRVQMGKGRYLNRMPGARFQFLTTLIIGWDDKVESLWEVGEVFRSCSSSLRRLTIQHCEKLRSVSGGLEYATALESLELSYLPELTFDETEEAQGEQDGQRTSFPWQSFGQRLQSLRLDSLPELVHLPKWIGNLSSLRYLLISDCKGLKSLPEAMRNLTSLEKLSLAVLNPRLMERCRIGGEDRPKIQHIPDISFSPWR